MKLIRKYLSIILGLGLALALFLIIPSEAKAAATLYLSPSATTVSVGQTFSVAIVLDTGGSETVGTDIRLSFDNARLEVVSLTDGVTYSTYPSGGKVYDNIAGTIRWSGSASSPDNFFSGSGTFGTISFRAKAAGTGSVSFDYTSGSTTDTNVVEGGTLAELLTSQPQGGTYIVSGDSGSSGTSGTGTAGTSETIGGIGGPSATEGGTATDGASLDTAFFLPTVLLILLVSFLFGLGGVLLVS